MESSADSSPFLRSVRDAIRVRHFSIRTEEAYVHWTKRFILFHGKRHPVELGESEVAAFLTHLAVEGQVASATQNQALNALVFLYRNVLDRALGACTGIVRAKQSQRVPVVLTGPEVATILQKLNGVYWLIAIRVGTTPLGECSPADQRSRLRSSSHRRAGWKGRQGPRRDSAR